jgi:ADP-ribose pyrophosphatase
VRERKKKRVFQGRWLSIAEATYRSPDGAEVNWEVVERAREETVIIVLARLLPSQRYVLVRQFRAGVNNHVIALPAGILPAGVDPRVHAVRELKEETGYAGRVIEESPPLKINPAILDCDVRVLKLDVDENDPANRSPLQSLEPEEEIEVVLKKPAQMRAFFEEERKRGSFVDVACWFIFCC